MSDARVLYDAQRYDGCVYLAGLALEMALKARIIRHLDLEEYPNDRYFKTHDLDQLLILTGLQREKNENEALFVNWSQVTEAWGTSLRYEEPGGVSETVALNVLDALSDQNGGLLPWLKTLW